MGYDIQKAGILRRFSAGLLDGILLLVFICGIAWGTGEIVDLQGASAAVSVFYDEYAEKYDVDFSLSESEMATWPSEDQARYEAAIEAMNNDEEAVYALMEFMSLCLMVISVSVLAGHLLLEFLVPLLFKNGQTVGKKIFGIALMRKDGVMVNPFVMFVRSILGKCTIEIMVPIAILFALFMGIGGMIGLILLFALIVAQIVLLFFHPNNAIIHDLLACTVEVDLSSQLIFSSTEAMLDYQKQRAAEKAERADY